MLFLVSLPAVTARLYSSDEVQYYSYLRSLYFDRDVSFANEYRYFYERNIAQSAGFHETFLERETAAGRRVNYATMGSAILWLPFYATADLWTRVTAAAEPDGFTQPYISAVAYGSAVYAFLAVLLSVRAARLLIHRGNTSHTGNTSHRRNTGETQKHSENVGIGREGLESPEPNSVSQGGQAESQKPRAEGRARVIPKAESQDTSLIPALAVWVGTPLLFYMYVAPPFAHACSAFAVALFVNVWLHVRQEWSARGAFALGLSAALMAMVREQDAFLALGPAADFLWSFRSASIITGIAGLAGVAAGFSPQLLAYNALNGYPGPAEHVSRKMYWYSPHALQVLASPHNGFFFWTPLALLAIVGLFALRDRRMMTCLLIMVASQVYVAGAVDSWTVAGAFGQRRFVCLTAILVIGVAAAWNAATIPRRGLAVIVALCVWWNVALMAQFATRLMDRQRLEPARNAYHAFVTLPLRAPSLVYRYLTDRESFYESHPAKPSR